MSDEEHIKQIAERFASELVKKQRDKAEALPREHKQAWLRKYCELGGLFKVDIDQILADEAIANSPHSALDDALVKCAATASAITGMSVTTPEELQAVIEVIASRQPPVPSLGVQVTSSPNSVRKHRDVGLVVLERAGRMAARRRDQ